MHITILAIGKSRNSAEDGIILDYLDRFKKAAKPHGINGITIKEFEARQSDKKQEAELLLKAIPKSSYVIALDERGKTITSREFADKLSGLRLDAHPDLTFIIGGADGLEHSVIQRSDYLLSFGKMVWPHMLARLLLSEQLYRAATILSGTPYHRD